MPAAGARTLISGQTEVALGILRILAVRRRPWRAIALADALETSPDVVGELLGRLAAAGWLTAARSAQGTTYTYADPEPDPTLGEVIAVIDGASVADDCVLHIAPCRGFTGGPVCSAHASWLSQLWSSALITIPVVTAPALGGFGPSQPGRAAGRLMERLATRAADSNVPRAGCADAGMTQPLDDSETP